MKIRITPAFILLLIVVFFSFSVNSQTLSTHTRDEQGLTPRATMTNWEVLKASQFTLEFKVLKYEGGDYCLRLLGQYEGTYYLTHKNDLLVITFTDSTSLSLPAKRSHLSKDDPMDGKPPLWNNDYVVSNESFNVLTSKNVQSIYAIDQKKKKPYTYLVDPEKQAMIKNALLLVK